MTSFPKYYNPFSHLLFPSLFAGGVGVISLSKITSFELWMLPIFVTTWVILLFFEWAAHKFLLHRPTPPLTFLFQMHLVHHENYTDQDMAIKNLDELYYVLMPPYAVVIVFGMMVPICLGLTLLFGLDLAMVVLVAAMGFFISYELLHFCYHLPEDVWIMRLGIFQWLRRFHQTHHHPDNFRAWNFNVTIPLADWVLGTLKK